MSETKNFTIMPDSKPVWRWAMAAGLGVMAAQWWLVARAGTDLPVWDQWSLEGKWLYPAWCDGTLRLGDLFHAYNGHRLVWTFLLDLSLFALNGQWDPLLQMTTGAALHAFGAGFLVLELTRCSTSWKVHGCLAAGVALAFIPLASWFNALVGLQTHTYFTLIFSFMAFAWLGAENASHFKLSGGLMAGLAAMLSFGAGELVPVALLGLAVLRVTEKRQLEGVWRSVWPALVLLAVAVALMMSAPIDRALEPGSPKQFIAGFMRVMAWPHPDQRLAALVLNLPLVLVVVGRIARRRPPRTGENFVLLIGGWALATALALAWARGGDTEIESRVPSRYVDFVMLLPLANAWCAIVLAAEAMGQWRARARVLATIWCCFLLIGWLGVSMLVWRGIVRIRVQDRLEPVRLAVAFQTSGDWRVYIGHRPYIPCEDLDLMLAVLSDPRMQGRLPPSFQPKRPLGPLSSAVRTLLRQ